MPRGCCGGGPSDDSRTRIRALCCVLAPSLVRVGDVLPTGSRKPHSSSRTEIGRYRPMSWLAVFIGGGLGSMLRFWLGLRLAAATAGGTGSSWPWGTWTVNVLGCLLAGLLYAAMDLSRPLMQPARVLLVVGFCGGFTTFSAFALELWLLAPERPRLAAAYVLSSVLFSLLACGLGLWIGRGLRG